MRTVLIGAFLVLAGCAGSEVAGVLETAQGIRTYLCAQPVDTRKALAARYGQTALDCDADGQPDF